MNSWRSGYCYHCHHKQLFHKSCVTVSYNQNNRLVASPCVSIISIWMDYQSYRFISIINDFTQKSYVTVSYNGKSAIFVLYQQSLPLFRMDICTLTLRSAAPPSGGPPPSTSDGGRDLGLCSCYMIMCYVSVCQCVHNLRSISLDYPGQARLPNWLTKFSKPLSRRGESASPPCTVCRAADYAACSPPLGSVLFIF